MPVVGVEDISTYLGIVPRRIQQLVRDEGMPQAARGKYDLYKCGAWYIRYLQKKVQQGATQAGDDGMLSWRSERARAMRAEASLKEMELARARGELVSVDEATRLWDDTLSRIRSRMISSVATGAVQLVGVRTTAEAHAVLEAVVDDALSSASGVAEEIGGDENPGAGARAGRRSA